MHSSRKWLIALSTTVLVGGLLAAPSAHAAQPTLSKDETFEFLINAADYYYGSTSAAKGLAKDMCRDIKRKKKRAAKREVAETYRLAMRLGSGWSDAKIAEFSAIATTVYCPAQSKYLY